MDAEARLSEVRSMQGHFCHGRRRGSSKDGTGPDGPGDVEVGV